MKSAPRTGVIQPLPGIGDMIWHLPALQAIADAAPDGKITLFARPSSQAHMVLRAEPRIAAIVDLPPVRRGMAGALPNFFTTWLALTRSRPDSLIILHPSQRYSIAARLAGIPKIHGYGAALARRKADGWTKSLDFLQQIGIPVAKTSSALPVDTQRAAALNQRYQAHPKPWIIIAPGASEPSRLWPVENFAACADGLAEMFGGTVFLVGSEREAGCIATIRQTCRLADGMVPVIGLPFDEVIGLIANGFVLLGNDSGPANVAAAMGKPAFAVCGSTAPPPHSPNIHIVKADLPPDTGKGMARISVKHVLRSIQTTIGLDGMPDIAGTTAGMALWRTP